MDELYNKLLECVDQPKYKKIKVKEFLKTVCMLAEKLYNVKVNILFEKMNSNSWGSAKDNTITINTRYIKLRYLHELTNTIFHEIRHVYQHKTIKKELNSAFEPKIPPIATSMSVYFIKESETNINPYFLYYISQNEKDARDTARENSIKLFTYIYSNVKCAKIKKLFKFYVTNLKSNIPFENDLYNECLSNLPQDVNYIKNITIFMIEKTLTLTQKAFFNKESKDNVLANNSKKIIHHIEPTICGYVNLYCDEFIKKQIVEFCLQNKTEKECMNALLTTFNSYYCKVNKSDWGLLFKLCDTGNITMEQIKDKMFHYRMKDIQNLYQIFKNKQIITKNSQINNLNLQK